jgi:2-dehydro-3-deoxy-L-rhamnonate dehydrogenase (NAD+)
MNRLDFKNRRAIVTGGASGIGLAIARRLLDSDARVALWDRDERSLEAARDALRRGVDTFVVDVTDAAGVERAAATTAGAMAGIDVLVCSAGITGPNTTTWEYPVDAWRAVFDVNVHGLFLCNRAVVPLMQRADYGRIVNIASVAGKEGNPNASAYSASKAAVIALTKSLGKELAKTGIRVNCVTPAAVRTAIFDQMTQAHIDFMLSKIPMGRFGTVDEIASLACWLASEECSFSTGAVFDASGGRATY